MPQGIGGYQFNSELTIRSKTAEGETWLPVYEALNLKRVKEFAQPPLWEYLDSLLKTVGLEVPGTPVAAKGRMLRQQAEGAAEEAAERERQRLREENLRRQQEEMARRKKPARSAPEEERPAPWGTPEAKRKAVEPLRRQIEESDQKWKK